MVDRVSYGLGLGLGLVVVGRTCRHHWDLMLGAVRTRAWSRVHLQLRYRLVKTPKGLWPANSVPP